MSAAPQLAEELFHEHYRRIYRYCLHQLGSPEEAEDAVQATYLNACRSLMEGFEPEAAQAWLFKVAHNVCLTRQRSSYRRARVERPQDLQAVQDLVAAPESPGDELFGLDEALADLPEQQRQAILLREWQGLSYREVAAKLGLSQAAVETLIFRARRSLASALERPVRRRRRLLHTLDVGALLASLKAAVAGNAAASVATAVAVAASATALTAAVAPGVRDDFPPRVAPPVQVETPKRPATPRERLADRSAAVAVSTIAASPEQRSHPEQAATKENHGANGKHKGQGKAKGKTHAQHPAKPPQAGNGQDPASAPPGQVEPPGQAKQADPSPSPQSAAAPAHGEGGKKG